MYGDALMVYFGGGLTGYVFAVEDYCAVGGLVNPGEQVENGGFSGAVGADEAVKLALFDFNVKIVHGAKTAERNAQIGYLKH